MTEPSEEDLLKALTESLEKDSRFGRLKAELRNAVMSTLDKNPTVREQPIIPEQINLINDIVREYLVWNGYTYSEQTLTAESNARKASFSRDNLATALGVIDSPQTKKIPLLYYLISAFSEHENSQTLNAEVL